jgi:L-rhamnose isomerase
MGSPTIGGPKYTAAATYFRRRGMDLDWIEEEIKKRESRPIRQPITAIFSKSDSVVSWQATIDHHSENVTHVEVDAAHLGMGFNPTILAHVVSALEQ